MGRCPRKKDEDFSGVKIGRFRPAPSSGAVSAGAVMEAVVLPCGASGVQVPATKVGSGPSAAAAAGVLVVGQRQCVVQALMAEPPLASIAIISLWHILPVSTHMLRIRR